jgi:two-component system CheB/CheR fusion protein
MIQGPDDSAKDDTKTDTQAPPVPVIGVAASAGGLGAFRAFLKHLATDNGAAYVLIQHLDPHHESILVDLLRKDSPLPVSEAEDGMAVEPNHVYVIPPNQQILLYGDNLHLAPETADTVASHPADVFLESLADDRGSQAVGVVLSGTASDGTKGCFAIKSAGGTTFAQDEQSAEFPGMPNSAVASGCIDFVMPPEQIAAELRRVIRHPAYRLPALEPKAEAPVKIPREMMQKVLLRLRSRTGHDFSHYKPTTIQRRIAKRMMVQRIDAVSTYVNLLQSNPGEVDALFDELLINVTDFFRDPETFEELRTALKPALSPHRPADQALRVWVPGCSTGQEVYSIAMLIHELAGEIAEGRTVAVQIFGSDIDDDAVETARRGLYADHDIDRLSPARRTRYFHKVAGGYQVNKMIRDMCVFAVQNIVRDPPFSNLDLVSCRNLLIYLNGAAQKQVLRMFHYALKPRGILMLGSSETIGGQSDLFSMINKPFKLYQKKSVAARLPMPDISLHGQRQSPLSSTGDGLHETPFDLDAAAQKALLTHYAPPGVLVDADYSILRFYGRTWPFIEAAPGAASLNLFHNAHPDIVMELRATVHTAMSTGENVRHDNVRYTSDGKRQRVAINAICLAGPTRGEEYLLLLFEDQGERDKPVPAGAASSSGKDSPVATLQERNLELEKEVADTRSYMQAIVEEQEGTNEELRSANEEIQSTNEELQSTNEELETAKEELQSANEELATVNEELENRNREVDLANSDLLNLLASVNLPIVIVDADLRIRQFTDPARDLLNLVDADVGRRIDNIRSSIEIPGLHRRVMQVIEGMVAQSLELQDGQGRWFSVRLRPYRTIDKRVDGAVLAYIDVTEVKAMKQTRQALENEKRLAMIVRDSSDAITLQDFDGNIEAWNPAAARLYGYSEDEAIGMNAKVLLPEADLERMSAAYEALRQGHDVPPIEITRIHKDGRKMPVRVVLSSLVNDDEQPIGLVTTERPTVNV